MSGWKPTISLIHPSIHSQVNGIDPTAPPAGYVWRRRSFGAETCRTFYFLCWLVKGTPNTLHLLLTWWILSVMCTILPVRTAWRPHRHRRGHRLVFQWALPWIIRPVSKSQSNSHIQIIYTFASTATSYHWVTKSKCNKRLRENDKFVISICYNENK